MHALYIDDLCEAQAVDLKRKVIIDPVQRPFPLNYHERTQHVLPAGSILQNNLTKVENFTFKNKMKINESKSKIMIFNKSRKYDFPPEFAFKNGEILEYLEETKLLGIHLSSDLKWQANSRAIYIKAMSKMWLLREGFKKKEKKRNGLIHRAGWLGSAWVRNPTKKIIAETASNNLTNDLEQKKMYPKKQTTLPPRDLQRCYNRSQ